MYTSKVCTAQTTKSMYYTDENDSVFDDGQNRETKREVNGVSNKVSMT